MAISLFTTTKETMSKLNKARLSGMLMSILLSTVITTVVVTVAFYAHEDTCNCGQFFNECTTPILPELKKLIGPIWSI